LQPVVKHRLSAHVATPGTIQLPVAVAVVPAGVAIPALRRTLKTGSRDAVPITVQERKARIICMVCLKKSPVSGAQNDFYGYLEIKFDIFR